MQSERPDVVVLAAAKVGGILANNSYPGEFIQDNLAIQTNVIHEAWRAGVKRLLFLGSSCIYPRNCPQPIREEYLLTGPLEPTNRPYAVAKIAGLEMCWAYNRQYGTDYLCVMPTNLYGPGDNYDLQTSHVLPALMRKFHDAKVAGAATVTLWGSGQPRREFLHSDDLGAACARLLELSHDELAPLLHGETAPLVNVGWGEDLRVADLADTIRLIVGCEAKIVWDDSKPDGIPRKLLDISRISALGWQPTIPLVDGIRRTYEDYRRQRSDVTPVISG
jgi:GDP-L-fucose synthase